MASLCPDFTFKFGQLDLFTTSLESKSLADLPDILLLNIFALLNIRDVSSISLVNKCFARLTRKIIEFKKKHLVVNFGVGPNQYPLQNRARLVPASSGQRKITSVDPIMVDNNRLLSEANRALLKPVESLIFYTHNLYRLSPTFHINLMPNLKFLQTNDFEFHDSIVNSSDNGMLLPNIEHLVLGLCPFDVLCKSFPNVVYVEVS